MNLYKIIVLLYVFPLYSTEALNLTEISLPLNTKGLTSEFENEIKHIKNLKTKILRLPSSRPDNIQPTE